jgi:hypothetical protein
LRIVHEWCCNSKLSSNLLLTKLIIRQFLEYVKFKICQKRKKTNIKNYNQLINLRNWIFNHLHTFNFTIKLLFKSFSKFYLFCDMIYERFLFECDTKKKNQFTFFRIWFLFKKQTEEKILISENNWIYCYYLKREEKRQNLHYSKKNEENWRKFFVVSHLKVTFNVVKCRSW